MPATIQIRRLTGVNASITSTDITSACTRASTSDAAAPGASNPIPIPTSGSNHSYWVTTQLNATVAPDNSITNIKWYSDGSNTFGTGVTAIVATASAYASATGTAGSSGSVLNTTNHASLVGAPSDMFTYTSGCLLSVAGSIGNTTGSFGNRVIWQLSVISTASPGNTGEETLTFQFDES